MVPDVPLLWRAEYALHAGNTALITALVLPLLARGNVLDVLARQNPLALWRQAPLAFCLETLANLAVQACQHADLAHDLLLHPVLRRVVRQATQLR
jgi:hypothetical protein